jgi:hypothetical protein
VVNSRWITASTARSRSGSFGRVIVVVLGGIRPGLVGDTAGGIGDAGALLGEFQGGPLGLGEDLRPWPPGGQR